MPMGGAVHGSQIVTNTIEGYLKIKPSSVVMSNLNYDAIESGRVQQRLAKAWVIFDGTNGNILADFNVASVSRLGAGSYRVTFSTAFSDTNYVMIPGASGNALSVATGDTGKTASTCDIGSFHYNTGARSDEPIICAAFFSL